MRRGLKRPRYIVPGDIRSPLQRLLEDNYSEKRGTVEVDYEQQFRTLFKAQRDGYVDDRAGLTDKGRAIIAEWAAKKV